MPEGIVNKLKMLLRSLIVFDLAGRVVIHDNLHLVWLFVRCKVIERVLYGMCLDLLKKWKESEAY